MYIIHRPEISEGFRGGSEVSGFQGQTTKLQNRSRSALAAFGSFVDCPPIPPQYPPIPPGALVSLSPPPPASRPTKSPPPAPGAFALTAGFRLPADLEAGSAARAAVRAAAKDVAAGHKLDPKRTVAFVVRGLAGLAQCFQAALLRARRGSGESRQLEDHPRTGIQFLHAEGQGRSFGGYLELGTCSYVGFSGNREILAVAAENSCRLRRTYIEPASCEPASSEQPARATTSARTSRRASSARTSTAAAGSTPSTGGGGGAHRHPSDIALAHRGIPGRLDLTGLVDGDSVTFVIDENEGIRDTANRAVHVVEHRGLIAPVAIIIVAPLKLHRWEIHRLGVDEFGALYGVVGAHSEAGIQQVRDRSRLAGGVVLEIHEGVIVQFMTVVVELVAADREIRDFGLRQAAAVSHLRRRSGVAGVLGFADEQRVHHPRRKGGPAEVARRMRVADAVVGQLQVLECVHLTAGPDAATPVLVGGEILDDRLHLRAVRVRGIGKRNMPARGEMAIRPGAAVHHETIKVRMGGVALELPHPRSTRPGLRADLRAFELARRMLRQGEPEPRRLGPSGHVVPVNIIRIGDPESRRRVVGRDQDILRVLAVRIEVFAALRPERAEVCRNTRFAVGMTLGQDPQVVDELVAVL